MENLSALINPKTIRIKFRCIHIYIKRDKNSSNKTIKLNLDMIYKIIGHFIPSNETSDISYVDQYWRTKSESPS